MTFGKAFSWNSNAIPIRDSWEVEIRFCEKSQKLKRNFFQSQHRSQLLSPVAGTKYEIHVVQNMLEKLKTFDKIPVECIWCTIGAIGDG